MTDKPTEEGSTTGEYKQVSKSQTRSPVFVRPFDSVARLFQMPNNGVVLVPRFSARRLGLTRATCSCIRIGGRLLGPGERHVRSRVLREALPELHAGRGRVRRPAGQKPADLSAPHHASCWPRGGEVGSCLAVRLMIIQRNENPANGVGDHDGDDGGQQADEHGGQPDQIGVEAVDSGDTAAEVSRSAAERTRGRMVSSNGSAVHDGSRAAGRILTGKAIPAPQLLACRWDSSLTSIQRSSTEFPARYSTAAAAFTAAQMDLFNNWKRRSDRLRYNSSSDRRSGGP